MVSFGLFFLVRRWRICSSSFPSFLGLDSDCRCKMPKSARGEQMWSPVFKSLNHFQGTRWKQGHNLIPSNKPVGSVAIDALVVLTSAARQLCRITVSSGRLCVFPPLYSSAMLLSAGDTACYHSPLSVSRMFSICKEKLHIVSMVCVT